MILRDEGKGKEAGKENMDIVYLYYTHIFAFLFPFFFPL
jgi:hypothetical protein